MFLAATLILASVANAIVLGEGIDGYSVNSPGGMKLAKGVYWTGIEYQTENYIEYSPSAEVMPIVVYGSKVTNYGNFKTMASLLENQGTMSSPG